MVPILDLVKNYLTEASKGEAKLSPELVKEFEKACGEALRRQFNPQSKKWRIRMSGLGKPLCQQQLDKKVLPISAVSKRNIDLLKNLMLRSKQ